MKRKEKEKDSSQVEQVKHSIDARRKRKGGEKRKFDPLATSKERNHFRFSKKKGKKKRGGKKIVEQHVYTHSVAAGEWDQSLPRQPEIIIA